MSTKNAGSKGESLLIQKIREGDEHAYEIAFLKYYTLLCQYVWKYVRSEELSKEIVQEVFAEVWEGRTNLKVSGHLRGFLFEVARNKALDYIKHQKVVKQYLAEARQQKKENLYQSFYQEDGQSRDFYEAVKAAIDSLPPIGRRIFKLNRDEGLTYQEISEYLNISVKTVETHMRRSLKKLREQLAKYAPSILIAGILGTISLLVS